MNVGAMALFEVFPRLEKLTLPGAVGVNMRAYANKLAMEFMLEGCISYQESRNLSWWVDAARSVAWGKKC